VGSVSPLQLLVFAFESHVPQRRENDIGQFQPQLQFEPKPAFNCQQGLQQDGQPAKVNCAIEVPIAPGNIPFPPSKT